MTATSASSLPNLETLSITRTWDLSFRAEQSQRLPPLPTKSLHGALGHALRRLCCLEPTRKSCSECPSRASCPYVSLFEPVPRQRGVKGVTNRAPAPFALAPGAVVQDDDVVRAITLSQGETYTMRLALIGRDAVAQLPLMQAALKQVGERGIGVAQNSPQRAATQQPRPRLSLTSIRPASVPVIPPDGTAVLRWRTPVRFKRAGKIQRHIDTRLLWNAMTRRADILAQQYGTGPVDLPEIAPFDIVDGQTDVTPITRYSSRQGRHIDMPGVLGSLRLRGEFQAWAPLWQMLHAAQLGKATTFGFGRFDLVAPEDTD